MPNIFKNVYVEPTTFVPEIPQKVVDTEGALSFALNGHGFFFFIFFYLIFALIVFGLTSKYNSNRPLKNMFIKIWNTRVKFGILNDFLWLFTTNTLVCAWMQYRYTANGNEIAMGTVFMLFFMGLLGALLGWAVKLLRKGDEESEKILK